MNTTIRGLDGHGIAVRRVQRDGVDDCLSLVIYGPQGGFRASVDLSPAAANELGSWITGYDAAEFVRAVASNAMVADDFTEDDES